MTPGEYDCPDCGDPRVALAPGADGEMLASCQGCGRAHGPWREVAAPAKTPKRTVFAGWFLRRAAR
ncbi:MAG TPA: hypothetical protein VFE10_12640 [Phenylobacterium sp.]|jgi:hypothetical protein|nr:hypothetical protein [Phenylobacterium sp.]